MITTSYFCPICSEFRANNVFDFISHISMKHGHGNPFKEEERENWLNPSRRDNLDITKLRERYGNGE